MGCLCFDVYVVFQKENTKKYLSLSYFNRIEK